MPRFPSLSVVRAARLSALVLAALMSAGFGVAQAQPQPAMQLAARDAAGELGAYRQILADAVAKTFREKYAVAAFQAGLLRTARAPQPGDYAVCLQTIENGRVAYFAAFITGNDVGTIRRAVGIDRCWLETNYSLLPPAHPPNRKPDRNRQSAR